MAEPSELIALWLVLTNTVAFTLFGWDKWQARRAGRRIAEFQLVMWGAIGGWVGGLVGMLVFRHKVSKGRFQLKYASGLLVLVALTWACFRWVER